MALAASSGICPRASGMAGSAVGKVRRHVTISTLPNHIAMSQEASCLDVPRHWDEPQEFQLKFLQVALWSARLLVVESIDDNQGLLHVVYGRLLFALAPLMRLCCFITCSLQSALFAGLRLSKMTSLSNGGCVIDDWGRCKPEQHQKRLK